MVSPNIRIIVENESGVAQGEFQNARNITWTRFLSGVGELAFTLSRDDTKFSLLTPMKSHIKVVRDGTVVWKGVFDFFRESKNDYTIWASSYESLLDYYLVQPDAPSTSTVRSFAAKKLGTEIAQVLFAEAEALTDSLLEGFTVGTVENPYEDATVTELTADFDFDYDTLYEVIERLAQVGGADFEIDFNKQFNFYRSKGSAKPNIVFRLVDGEASNITEFRRDVDYRKIGNKLYTFGVGVRANFLKEIQSDATSQTSYGLMERNLGMPRNLVDQDTLTKITKDRLKLTKQPEELISPSIILSTIGLYDGWEIGDTITLVISVGATNISVSRRIIGVATSYSNSGAESVNVYMENVKE